VGSSVQLWQEWVGLAVGLAVGLVVGLAVGLAVGLVVGLAVGLAVGLVVGLAVGLAVGLDVGLLEDTQLPSNSHGCPQLSIAIITSPSGQPISGT